MMTDAIKKKEEENRFRIFIINNYTDVTARDICYRSYKSSVDSYLKQEAY